LHPRGPRGVPHQPSPEEITTAFETAQQLVTEAMMMEAVADFKNTAPGPSGLRPTHLKDALEATETKHLRRELLRFLHLLMSGHVHPRAMKYFCSAVLIAIPKENGCLRPIAIGETLRRLVCKCVLLCAPVKEALRGALPFQCGAGFPRATSIVAIGLQQLVNAGGPIGDWAILKVDLRNAFNCISRSKIRQVVQHDAPELSSFVHMTHTEQPELYLTGNAVLRSEVGLQQGDPIAAFLFVMAMRGVVAKAHQALEAHAPPDSLVWSQWYLDDGVFFGPLPALKAAMKVVVEGAKEAGIDINYRKSWLWGPAASDSLHTTDSFCIGITVAPFVPNLGRVILGLPIAYPGTAAPSVDKHCEDKAKKVLESLKRPLVDWEPALTPLEAFTRASPLLHLLQGVYCKSAKFLIILDGINAAWRSVGLPHDIHRIRPRLRFDALVAFVRSARCLGLPIQGQAPPPDLLAVLPSSANVQQITSLLNTLRSCPAQEFSRTLDTLLTQLTEQPHDDSAVLPLYEKR